jgi:YidC/Oxa1 family membrane protein insertase
MFEIIAKTLSVFYDLVPSYVFAIAMLTLAVMVVTTPFTLKGTRSMIQMQRLQPEMRRIQLKYKDDRQKQNEELMAFYRENNINPLGGCLPLLLQMPVFFILFRVLRGLTHLDAHDKFSPQYLDSSSALYRSLHGKEKMLSFGVDLAESASKALQESFSHALPHLALVGVVAATSYYQQKQIAGRNKNQEIPQQQQMLMKIMPGMFVVFAFVSPTALVVYFVVSNLYRIGMQAYITRTLYHGEDSLGAQAQRAAVEAKKLREEEGGPSLLPRLGKRGADPAPATTKAKPAASTPATAPAASAAPACR